MASKQGAKQRQGKAQYRWAALSNRKAVGGVATEWWSGAKQRHRIETRGFATEKQRCAPISEGIEDKREDRRRQRIDKKSSGGAQQRTAVQRQRTAWMGKADGMHRITQI